MGSSSEHPFSCAGIWLAAKRTIRYGLYLVGFVVIFTAAAVGHATDVLQISRAEAVQSDWDASTPPDTGWVQVPLPDDWTSRWPQYDGVVWYRMTWVQPKGSADLALFVGYLNMAGAVQINGAEVLRDDSLREPLSRMWNTPRYILLSAPLLRERQNELLIRVSGLAPYSPGLGPIKIGASRDMRELYEHDLAVRRDWQIFTMAVIASLGFFFFVLWLIRHTEVAYGWYSAYQFAWLNGNWNLIAISAWPFTSTDAFEVTNTAMFLLFSAFYTLFVLRFCDQRWPRREACMWLLVAAAALRLLLAPHEQIGQVRADTTIALTFYAFVPNCMLLYFAARSRRLDLRIMAAVGAVNLAALSHDTLVFVGFIDSNIYYAQFGALFCAVGAAAVLAWSFARSLRRIEGFNAELQRSMEEARTELADTLARQHELELVYARLGERVNLAHDLHDGLGGMLIGNIAAVEQSPGSIPSHEVLSMFRELRDDLRLIIDTASAQHYGEHSLAELLAPLRHRMTRLLETNDIDLRWQTSDLDTIYLTTSRSLDVLRILQESLANILKHSRATNVEVNLRRVGEDLLLEVMDNGVGIGATSEDSAGIGMRSMKTRALRLKGTLSMGSHSGVTMLRLQVPLENN
jgi:signal transduction histidine kinase